MDRKASIVRYIFICARATIELVDNHKDMQLPESYDDISSLLDRLHNESEAEWQRRGEARALEQFRAMSERVPAYKDFLLSKNFSPESVRSIRDFVNIPTIDKDNYLRKYPLEMLSWDGDFPSGRWTVSSTSGSTGHPFYFPRGSQQDRQYSVTAELYLRSNFHIDKLKTLYIDAFPMGVWIGGLFTYEALRMLCDAGKYDITIITTGIHKQEVINAVRELGGKYEQIIIGAYAPFLKDILDDAVRQGVNWGDYNVNFIFSAEAFSEKFRDYVLRVADVQDTLRGTLNHYGTVDMGTMAHETPESILIRRELVDRGGLKILFPEVDRQPTLAQYNPEMFYFEQLEDTLLCTAYSGLPLLRYDLKDHGGIISRQEVHRILKEQGIDIGDLLLSRAIQDTQWNLPFVYVYERNDFSVSYYAFQLYPDTIRRALLRDELSQKVTGKFSMKVDYDDSGRQRLNIHVELKHGIIPSEELKNVISEYVQERLIEESSEYRETFNMVGTEAIPTICLWDYEDPTYFRPGIKQKWTVK